MICQNIVFMMQAIGLGGWMYSGIFPYSVLGAFADEGVPGLGFRFVSTRIGRCQTLWGSTAFMSPSAHHMSRICARRRIDSHNVSSAPQERTILLLVAHT